MDGFSGSSAGRRCSEVSPRAHRGSRQSSVEIIERPSPIRLTGGAMNVATTLSTRKANGRGLILTQAFAFLVEPSTLIQQDSSCAKNCQSVPCAGNDESEAALGSDQARAREVDCAKRDRFVALLRRAEPAVCRIADPRIPRIVSTQATAETRSPRHCRCSRTPRCCTRCAAPRTGG